MAAQRLSTRFNVRNDLFGSITPLPWVQDNIVVPHGEWLPAAWLPIVFTKSDVKQGEDAFVISSGKIVAQDRTGRIVPAGYRSLLNKSAATTVLTYTADDYAWGVTDLTTGQRYATNGTTSYNALTVAKALIERGLVPEDVPGSGAVPPVEADIPEIISAFISAPVGIMLYDVYVYSGSAEKGDQWMTNYSKQHVIQFTTEHQMKVPHRTSSDAGSSVFDVSAIATVTTAQAAGDFPQPGEVWEIAAIAGLSRYDLDGDEEIVALALDEHPVAKNTSRTPIACDVSGVLLREQTSLANVTAEGRWFLDQEVGLLFIHADTYAALVADNTDPTITYSFYDSATTAGAASDQWIYFDGEGRPGDFVSCDERSNFVVKGDTRDILLSTEPALGRLHYVISEPRNFKDKVKSAFNLTGMNAAARMNGTATAGYPDLITLAAESVADRIAVITVRI